MSVYLLSGVPHFIDLLKNDEKTLQIADSLKINVRESFTKNNQKYRVFRYDKNFLSNDLIPTYGLLRSVIVNNKNEVVCFAPPKSMPCDIFMRAYPNPNPKLDGAETNTIIAEEFVEGTMINIFWDGAIGINGGWEIATRSAVGAEVSFYKTKNSKTFKQMFLEAVKENGLVLDILNKKFCYSFVLQHPDNRIVIPFKNPQLYLVAVYEIIYIDETIQVSSIDMETVKAYGAWNQTTIKFPKVYTDWSTYTDLIEKYASPNTSYDILGVILKSKLTQDRCKIRNPIYEEIRNLRGNQPKVQYQYLQLRKNGKLSSFLNYYPEYKREFSAVRDQLHFFTESLFQNYLACYIKKENPLKEFPGHFRPHMFKIHEIYKNQLKNNGLYVTNTVVRGYVNDLHPSQQMFAMNYNMRKRNIDIIKTEHDEV
uniref:T4 RNA ligase 1-like N-terminal domain-containing protein n=1 Tax=viral metagenome TaxID=1070528 RepID=A0A6C0F3V4_9ZZZZ